MSALGAAAAFARLALGEPGREPLLIGAAVLPLISFLLLASFLLYLNRCERQPPLVVQSPLDPQRAQDDRAVTMCGHPLRARPGDPAGVVDLSPVGLVLRGPIANGPVGIVRSLSISR